MEVDTNYVQLHIPEENLSMFLCFFGLGVLHAIRTKTVTPEATLWLALPQIWEPLKEIDSALQTIRDLFFESDILPYLQDRTPEQYDQSLLSLITRFQEMLGQEYNPDSVPWKIEWILPANNNAGATANHPEMSGDENSD